MRLARLPRASSAALAFFAWGKVEARGLAGAERKRRQGVCGIFHKGVGVGVGNGGFAGSALPCGLGRNAGGGLSAYGMAWVRRHGRSESGIMVSTLCFDVWV